MTDAGLRHRYANDTAPFFARAKATGEPEVSDYTEHEDGYAGWVILRNYLDEKGAPVTIYMIVLPQSQRLFVGSIGMQPAAR